MKNQNLIRQFAINLREIRESKKLTQTAMSKVLSTSPAAYGQYEKGTRQPSLSALATIAKYFRVSIDKLVFDEYQQAKMFWTDNGYKVNDLDGGEISFILPVPAAQIVISNGNVTSLHGKEREIIFADKKSFADFTEKIQKKYRADFIGKCNEEVLNLYHEIEDGDSELLQSVHVKEMEVEKKYLPVK